MVKILKNCPKTIFDSSKEAFWCHERNTKDHSSLKITLSEKIKKNVNKLSFLVFLVKIGYFWRLFLFFSESVLCKELRSFALHFVHQDASFELSKTAFGQIFKISTIRRDTSDLGGVKISGKEKTGSKIKKKNCFGISMTKLTQKWVVEVWLTSLGCMAVLYCTLRVN